MTARLFLISPVVADALAFRPQLEAALAARGVASLLLRAAGEDDRAKKRIVQALAPMAQERDVAVLVEPPLDLREVTRMGADGVHMPADDPRLAEALETLKPARIVGAGNPATRHAAMEAGEADADYLLFGWPTVAPLDRRLERCAWWAEVFQVPGVGFAATLDEVAAVAATGIEFVALEAAIWDHGEGAGPAVRAALDAIAEAAHEAAPRARR